MAATLVGGDHSVSPSPAVVIVTCHLRAPDENPEPQHVRSDENSRLAQTFHQHTFQNLSFNKQGGNVLPEKIWKVKVLLAQVVSDSLDPMDCSPPGFSVHGVLQARILKWVALPFIKSKNV